MSSIQSNTTCFTPDSELDLLFSADLISSEVKSALHPNVHVCYTTHPLPYLLNINTPRQIRPLASTDYKRGHLSVLSILTAAPDPGEAAWKAHFDTLRASTRTYYTLVIVDKLTDKIAGVGTVFIERKFQRGLSSVGHIEDIAVDAKQQGKKLGLRIIQALIYISENSGAYKTILNCNDKNIRRSCYLNDSYSYSYLG